MSSNAPNLSLQLHIEQTTVNKFVPGELFFTLTIPTAIKEVTDVINAQTTDIQTLKALKHVLETQLKTINQQYTTLVPKKSSLLQIISKTKKQITNLAASLPNTAQIASSLAILATNPGLTSYVREAKSSLPTANTLDLINDLNGQQSTLITMGAQTNTLQQTRANTSYAYRQVIARLKTLNYDFTNDPDQTDYLINHFGTQ